MSLLVLENVSSGYGKKQVLFDISLAIHHREIALLIGGNGSGKSTLLKTVFNLVPSWPGTRAEISFNNEPISGRPVSSLLQRGLLYIPQKNNLFDQLTTLENLEIAGLSLEKRLLKDRIENVLALLPALQPLLKKSPFKMSGGERKILTLAMALIHRPKLILFDEPFAGLSNKNVIFVRDCIKKLNEDEKIGFLIVEHRVKETIDIAHQIISLKLGRIFQSIRAESDYDLNALYAVFI